MKRGISLIAVLMFMLASTTASVVLYKWLGSEGFASGARLKKSEAYQASESGLDAVQAWLSSRAADVGLVLSEYFSNTTYKPYNLNNVLAGDKKNFNVYLIGADTVKRNSNLYKLKFMSVGTGRDGSQVSQTAIFNVEGLYNIKVPGFNPTSSSRAKFEEDIWGNVASLGILDSRKALITQSTEIKNAGGQALNNIKIGTANGPGYLVLDGNYYVNAGMNVYGDVYVTGDFDFCPNNSNGNFITGNLYIGGVFHPKGAFTVGGDAFFKGGVNPNENINDAGTGGTGGCIGNANGDVLIGGNSTIKGNFVYYKSKTATGGGLGFQLGIPNNVKGGNLVMDSIIGKINLTRNCNDANSLKAYGNVYIKNNLTGEVPSSANDCSGSGFDKTVYENAIPVFGNSPGKTICVKGMEREPSPSTYYRDIITPKIKMISNKTNQDPSSDLCKNYKSWGADPMDGSISSINLKEKLEQGNSNKSCENTPIKFDETIYDEVKKPVSLNWVHKASKPGNCAINNEKMKLETQWVDFVTELKDCKNKAAAKNELKDGWLVVYLTHYLFNDYSASLGSGKYIIILDVENISTSRKQFYLPPTGNDAEVILYLPKGFPGTIELAGGTATSNSDQTIKDKYNYFIFSDGDIKEFNTTSTRTLTGNIFMNNCSILNENTSNAYLKTRGDNVIRTETDEDFKPIEITLAESLIAAGILKETGGCDANGRCWGTAVDKNDGTGGSESFRDSYIIPISPRLKVELESKYISKKEELKDNSPNSAKGFVLVMPRVVHLRPGTVVQNLSDLKNYYNLFYLNGAKKSEPPPSLSSCKKVTDDSYMNHPNPAEGIYKCTFPAPTKPNEPEVSEFHVNIQSNTSGGGPNEPPDGGGGGGGGGGTGGTGGDGGGDGGDGGDPGGGGPPLCTNCPPVTANCRLRGKNGTLLGENGTLEVTQGENINPPVITCSSGDPYSAVFSATTGVLPVNSMGLDWQYYSVYYGNTAGTNALGETGNAIALSSVYCDYTLVPGPIPCGTIKVNKPVVSCAVANGTQGGTVSVGQAIELNANVNCGNATSNKKFIPSSGGNNSLFYENNFVCFSTPSSGTNPRTISLKPVCDDHEINISPEIKCGSTGFLVQSSSSTCSFGSSSVTTIECSFPSNPLNVYLGQNINAPTITCSNDATPVKSSATFSTTRGVLPSNSNNWKSDNSPASYTNTQINSVNAAGNTITVSGVTCGDNLVSETTTCGNINVCAHNRAQANNCDDYIGTLTATNTTPANPYTACFKHTNNNCYVCKIQNEGGGNTCCSGWVWNSSQVDGNLDKGYWYQQVTCPVAVTATCQVGSLGNKSGNCYNVPRPSITCSDGTVAGTAAFVVDNNTSLPNWNESDGKTTSFCNSGTRPIKLNTVICGNTTVTQSLPASCGDLIIPQ